MEARTTPIRLTEKVGFLMGGPSIKLDVRLTIAALYETPLSKSSEC